MKLRDIVCRVLLGRVYENKKQDRRDASSTGRISFRLGTVQGKKSRQSIPAE